MLGRERQVGQPNSNAGRSPPLTQKHPTFAGPLWGSTGLSFLSCSSGHRHLNGTGDLRALSSRLFVDVGASTSDVNTWGRSGWEALVSDLGTPDGLGEGLGRVPKAPSLRAAESKTLQTRNPPPVGQWLGDRVVWGSPLGPKSVA